MSTSDVALARRVLSGDDAAFEEFFESRYFPRLFRFALPRVGGNEDATEDIVQRVLIQALARLQTYRGEAALLTWLCTLCRREVAAWYEHEGRLREVSFFDERPEIRAALEALAAVETDDPETTLGRRELSDLVRLTLDHLPGRYGRHSRVEVHPGSVGQRDRQSPGRRLQGDGIAAQPRACGLS